MADSTLANLSAQTSLVGTDILYGVRSPFTAGTDYKITAANITASVLATPTITGHMTVEGVTSTGATGSNLLVFATSPTLTTPVLGVATATSINKMAITAPATSSTLAVADGKTFTASNTMTLAAGADSQTFTFPATGDTVVTLTATQELTNKTLTTAVGKGTWTASGTWTLPAHTLGGTVSGGGQQLNNIIIGSSTPLAGTFTTLTAGSASSLTLGTSSSATGAIIFNNAGGAFTTTIQSGSAAASRTYTWPTNFGSAGAALTDAAGDGTLSWAVPGGISWGASITGSSGTGLTLTATSTGSSLSCPIGTSSGTAIAATSSALGGAGVLANFTHTASGTLTAKTTADVVHATSRTYTLTSGSVTDNFQSFTFARTNVTTGAGGTLLAQGSVVTISGTDTQTAGTLTPSYDLLQLVPTTRSTGSSINITVPATSVAPTNGHLYIVLNSTSSAAHTGAKIDMGAPSQANIGLSVLNSCVSTSSVGIQVTLNSGSSTGGCFDAVGGKGSTTSNFAYRVSSAASTVPTIAFGNSASLNGDNNDSNAARSLVYVTTFSSSAPPARSVSYLDLETTRTSTRTSGTTADNYDFALLKRVSVQNGGGGTFTQAGTVLNLQNSYTQTAGTLTDTVDVLSITQGSGSTGRPIAVTQNNITSTNFRKVMVETNTGVTLWMGNGTTGQGNLSGTAGDILFNGGTNKPEYCTGTTNWTALV